MGKKLNYEVNLDKPRINMLKCNLFQECNQFIRKNYNQNFHWDSLNWATRVWLGVLFKVLDKKINDIQKEIEERTII